MRAYNCSKGFQARDANASAVRSVPIWWRDLTKKRDFYEYFNCSVGSDCSGVRAASPEMSPKPFQTGLLVSKMCLHIFTVQQYKKTPYSQAERMPPPPGPPVFETRDFHREEQTAQRTSVTGCKPRDAYSEATEKGQRQ